MELCAHLRYGNAFAAVLCCAVQATPFRARKGGFFRLFREKGRFLFFGNQDGVGFVSPF